MGYAEELEKAIDETAGKYNFNSAVELIKPLAQYTKQGTQYGVRGQHGTTGSATKSTKQFFKKD